MMKYLHMTAFVLVVIGGLNWGLTALGWNAVNFILGSVPQLESLVYVLVGLSALYLLFTHPRECKTCAKGPATP